MHFTRKIILLSLMFVSVGGLVFAFGFSSKKEVDAEYLTKEMTINGWKLKPIVSDKAVLDSLEASVTVFADYFQPDTKESVNLYIGYYKTLEKSKMSHAPQVCFTAQGWIMSQNDKLIFHLGGQEKKINRLILKKGSRKLLVYYWYQVGSKVYADLFRMKLFLAGQQIIHKNDFDEGNAFIRISTPIFQSLESSSKLLQGYAKDVYLEYPKMFNHDL